MTFIYDQGAPRKRVTVEQVLRLSLECVAEKHSLTLMEAARACQSPETLSRWEDSILSCSATLSSARPESAMTTTRLSEREETEGSTTYPKTSPPAGGFSEPRLPPQPASATPPQHLNSKPQPGSGEEPSTTRFIRNPHLAKACESVGLSLEDWHYVRRCEAITAATARRAVLLAMYSQNLGLCKIAVMTGLNRATVAKSIKAHRVATRASAAVSACPESQPQQSDIQG